MTMNCIVKINKYTDDARRLFMKHNTTREGEDADRDWTASMTIHRPQGGDKLLPLTMENAPPPTRPHPTDTDT